MWVSDTHECSCGRKRRRLSCRKGFFGCGCQEECRWQLWRCSLGVESSFIYCLANNSKCVLHRPRTQQFTSATVIIGTSVLNICSVFLLHESFSLPSIVVVSPTAASRMKLLVPLASNGATVDGQPKSDGTSLAFTIPLQCHPSSPSLMRTTWTCAVKNLRTVQYCSCSTLGQNATATTTNDAFSMSTAPRSSPIAPRRYRRRLRSI
jgi:hypothetical protein